MRNIKNENIQTAINILSSLLVLIISAMINFFLSPYIIANVGEEANGFVQLANNFVTYASLITIALNSMASRFISLNYHSKKIKKANIYYSSTIISNIFIFIILGIVAIYTVNNLESLIVIVDADITDIKLLFLFVFINFFLSQISTVLSVFLFVLNKIYYSNFFTMISTIIRALLLLCLFLYDTKLYFVTLTSCVSSIFLIFSCLLLKSKSSIELKFNMKYFKLLAIKELFLSGIWNAINQCGNILMTGMDLLFANWFLGPVQMGMLSVAKMIPTYIIQVAQNINTSMAPNLLISSTKEYTYYLNQIKKMIKVSSIILVVPITVFIIFSYQFYELWVPSLDSLELSILSFLSIFSFIPLSGTQVLYNIFTIENKLKLNSISFLITGIINVILVFLFMKFTSFGIYAIAGVSVILSIIRNIFILIPYASYLLGLRWNYFYKSILSSLICFIITILICLFINIIFDVTSWMKIIIAIIVAIAISYLLCFMYILGKKETIILFNKVFRKREK